MKPWTFIRAILFGFFVLLAASQPGESWAGQLDDLRAQGLVGERFDGYAEARSGASNEVKKLVSEVNAKRKQIYAKRAQEQGVKPDQVARVYAQEIIRDLPAGAWVKTPDGWQKK